jgi:hypothetical protein
MVDMASWRINFLQWQSKADNVNKALAMPSEGAVENRSPEKTASKKAEPSTTAMP